MNTALTQLAPVSAIEPAAHAARPGAVIDEVDLLRSIFVSMAEGLVIQGTDGRVIDANPAAEAVLGLSREQLLGRTSRDPRWRAVREDGTPFPGEQHPSMVVLRTGRAVREVVMGIHTPAGELRWLSVNAQPLAARSGAGICAVVATFVDVTSAREGHARIRELAERLATVREAERNALATALHEGVAQELYAAKLALAGLQQHEGAQTTEVARELGAIIDRTIRDLRAITGELYPLSLLHLSLPQAIEHLVRQVPPRAALCVSVQAAEDFPALELASRLLFYRAAEEALANVVRHAQASRVCVTLAADGERVTMTVLDDGVGTQPQQLRKSGSLGLLGLRERFAAAAGALRIEPGSAGGTRLVACIPRRVAAA